MNRLKHLFVRSYHTIPSYQFKSSFDYIKQTGENTSKVIKETFDENSQKLLDSGIDQAVRAMALANKKFTENKIETTTTVTFNAGILQISFTTKNQE